MQTLADFAAGGEIFAEFLQDRLEARRAGAGERSAGGKNFLNYRFGHDLEQFLKLCE
jgi:hypothetical protein